MPPTWLYVLAWISVLLGIACAAYIALDVRKHPQHMDIMNYVWPLCALLGHVVIVLFYLKYGRLADRHVLRLPDVLSGQLVADQEGHQRGDVMQGVDILSFASELDRV
ncbi:hypothetical protein [Chromohalobacter israelensis]|uniref:hypothetical protein n=1 Tax=Chromohalobacter israelensis TaxID=141390 RepID=UPI001F0C8549|nr:hypothetical protein [Chromohalobacter salexigens]